jgi:hypothetical protein
MLDASGNRGSIDDNAGKAAVSALFIFSLIFCSAFFVGFH